MLCSQQPRIRTSRCVPICIVAVYIQNPRCLGQNDIHKKIDALSGDVKRMKNR